MINSLFTACIVALLPILAGATLFQAVKQDFSKYKLESACIMKHVKNGIARNRIVVKDGKCYVKQYRL